MDVFNIRLEFDPKVIDATIERCIRERRKASISVVDGNVLAIAQQDLQYREIIRNTTVNACDGSSIAVMVKKIYGGEPQVYAGPELFLNYIERPYRHVLLGNTRAKVEKIRAAAAEKGIALDMQHVDLPFVGVEAFDYKAIAARINEIQPDIVWVSLGAPKQETFIANILPYVDQGVFIGIGAAFSFYTGELHRTNKTVGGLRLRWLERIFKEPRKQLKRVGNILLTLPKMYREEKKRAKKLAKHEDLG